jgi:uncharacterized membrane protein
VFFVREGERHTLTYITFFHSYLIEGGVCYLTLCDRSYPKKLAYQYLEELQHEFEKVNRSQIETVARPYAFIKFGMASVAPFLFILVSSHFLFAFCFCADQSSVFFLFFFLLLVFMFGFCLFSCSLICCQS